MIAVKPPSPLTRDARRRLIIRRHRAMLEAEVRRLRIGWLGDEDGERAEDEEPSAS